jgi:chromosomal replication initiator protein
LNCRPRPGICSRIVSSFQKKTYIFKNASQKVAFFTRPQPKNPVEYGLVLVDPLCADYSIPTVLNPVTSGVVEIPLIGTPLENDAAPSFSSVAPFALPRFVVGPENQLIEVAVAAVLEEPTSAYNPLVLCGPSGSGKTHLSGGLFRAWKTLHPRRPAALVTATDFAREYRDAVETKTEDQFLVPYTRTRLLVVENLDELSGRSSAQHLLAVLIDDLLSQDAWIVVTSRTPPSRLSGLQERLRARLASGLAVQLALPDPETRRVILEQVAQLRGLAVEDVVLETLAEGLALPVPELVGALVQLEGESRLTGSTITLAATQRLLAERRDTRRPSLSQITKATAKHFALPVAELRGASRRRAIVAARNVAMYLARNLTAKSLDRIGAYFGNRDHTTVSHGCQKVEQRLHTEPAVRDAVVELRARLLLRG